MCLGRQPVYQLSGQAETYLIRIWQSRQQPVVVTLAPSQPVALSVEGYAGDDGQVNLRIVGEGRARGFGNVEGSRLQSIVAGVAPKFEVVSLYHRQYQLLAACPAANQSVRVYFVGQ